MYISVLLHKTIQILFSICKTAIKVKIKGWLPHNKMVELHGKILLTYVEVSHFKKPSLF